MTCEDARRLLSDRLDGELSPHRASGLDEHLAGCGPCQHHQTQLERLRAHLHEEPFPQPDLAGSVMAAVRRRDAVANGHHEGRRRRLLPVAAAFVGAALVGAVLVGSADRGEDVASADLAALLTEAQAEVDWVSATVEVAERGLHPDVPERRFVGHLEYVAPESLSLLLEDETTYPSHDWPANDVRLEVDDDRWSASGVRDCPPVDQPGCLSPEPELRLITEREPFASATPVPLDLITPVQSFQLAGAPVTLADEDVDGRASVGVEVTAAQVQPMLQGLRPAGNLREVHPSDPVELRLDAETLVPLAISVQVAPGELRQRWADGRGYLDEPGDVVLDVRMRDLQVGGADADEQPGPAAAGAPAEPPAPEEPGVRRSAGFVDGAAPQVPEPAATVLDGLRPHRSGQLTTPDGPVVGVRTWTDGRAWLAVRATEQWPGGRLFGDLGDVVRPLPLEDGRTAYLSQDGASLGLHGEGLDLVVTGSVGRAGLLEVVSSLGVEGDPVPDEWSDAASATAAEALGAGLDLLLPTGLDGFDDPGFRVDGPRHDPTVRAAFAGPGDRSFLLVQSAGEHLAPPLDTADVVAVDVAGELGRYSPMRGLLEWVDREANVIRSIESTSLGLAELLVVAEGLGPP